MTGPDLKQVVPIPPKESGLRPPLPKHPKHGKPDHLFPYFMAEGGLAYIVARWDAGPNRAKKEIRPLTLWEHPGGKLEWRWQKPETWLLYNLNQFAERPDAPILVVEGEGKAERAAELFPDFIVTTSGPSNSTGRVDWRPLAGRKVLVWADKDEAGLRYAGDVQGVLQGIAASAAVVAVPDEFPEKWDLGDTPPDGWDDARLLSLAEAALNNSAPMGTTVKPLTLAAAEEWPDPSPLVSKIEPEPYPLDALPEVIRAAVEEVHRFVKAPVPMVASSSIAAISLAGQACHNIVRAEKLTGPIGIYALIIADSGERKSTIDGFFTNAIRDYEAREAEAAKPLVRAHQAAMDGWEAKRNGVKDRIRQLAKSGEATSEAESELALLEYEKPIPPRVPRLIYGDATPEALKWAVAKVWPSAGVISSEAGSVLGAHGMGQESAMRNFATYNQLWDATAIQTDRRTSESFTVAGARLTMCLQVQEATLRAFLEKLGTLARGTGFLARCLVAWPESTQGSRPFTEAPSNWPALAKFNRRMTAILDQPAPIDENGALHPPELNFTHAAKVEWVAFYNRVESQLSAGGALFDLRDVASKIADNAARLAALFHLFEGSGGVSVGVEHLLSGCRIAEWHLHEGRRFYGELALPLELANAARLEAWLIGACLRKGPGETRIQNSEVQHYGPYGLREKAAIEQAMQVLGDLDRAQQVREGRRRFIEVNPALLKSQKTPTEQEAATAVLAVPAVFAKEEDRKTARTATLAVATPLSPPNSIDGRLDRPVGAASSRAVTL